MEHDSRYEKMFQYPDCCRGLLSKPDFKNRAGVIRTPLRNRVIEYGGWLAETKAASLNLVEYICPKCGTLLDTEVEVLKPKV